MWAFSEVQISKDDPDRCPKEKDVDLKVMVKDDPDLRSK